MTGLMMARGQNRLTVRQVDTIRKPGRYGDGLGLWLHVDENLSKRWVFVFQWRKVRKEMGLGSVRDVSLAEARTERDAARRLVAGGKNPIEERRKQKTDGAVTFGAVAEELIASLAPGWKSPKQAASWRRSFELYAAAIWGLAVDKIDTAEVLKVLQPVWLRIPDMAGKLRGRIERVLDAAEVKGLREGKNPAAWGKQLEHVLPRRPKLPHGHRPSMPYTELPAFMAELRDRRGPSARCLEFAILTVVRENEALGARRQEIDVAGRVWTIPGGRLGRMKGTNPPDHRAPLSDAAMAVLSTLGIDGIPPGDLLFPSETKDARGHPRPMSNAAMDRVLQRMGRGHYTVHGFRTSFRTWADEQTHFPRELAEMALAHQVGDEAERAYRRGDVLEKRRKMMEAWARYLYAPKGAVVMLRRG